MHAPTLAVQHAPWKKPPVSEDMCRGRLSFSHRAKGTYGTACTDK